MTPELAASLKPKLQYFTVQSVDAKLDILGQFTGFYLSHVGDGWIAGCRLPDGRGVDVKHCKDWKQAINGVARIIYANI